MESKRQKKVARQLQKDLGEILQQIANTHLGGAFVTVTGVKMTPDLGIARVYLSFLMANDAKDRFHLVEENSSFIRGELGRRIGQQVRKIPGLEFFIDNTAEEEAKIDKLFKDLNIPPTGE